jgi:prephenate dehydratase
MERSRITDMRIAIQGGRASFHHLAAEHYYGDGNTFVWCDTFTGVYESLAKGKADAALVAIENSMYGSLSRNYDLLQKYKIPIVGEEVEYIHHSLIGFPGAKLKDIKKVYSQAEALAQVSSWLEKNLPKAESISYHDTAGAVEHIKNLGDHSAAAIASTASAELHKMEVLAAEIQDIPLNFTRFLVLQNDGKPPKGANKVSLILTTSHEAGSLHRALGVIGDAGGNLTKLESRPIAEKVWKYQFYVDIELDPKLLDDVVAKLEAQDCEVYTLGIYQAAGTAFED